MERSRRLAVQAGAVLGMGVYALASPSVLRADLTPVCNTYCWSDCSDYGVSGCSANNSPYCTVAGCDASGTCSPYGLYTIVCTGTSGP